DSAVFGSASATRCGLDFFGAEHVLFASDSPFDPEKGPGYIRATMEIINNIDITPEERSRIFQDNAIALLRLVV
ncbi:MAG: amidohydrolase family protein, partial [Anaerolineales bacterium]|nr:amidohydrolase family protein [Anaerolineales bacterium]